MQGQHFPVTLRKSQRDKKPAASKKETRTFWRGLFRERARAHLSQTALLEVIVVTLNLVKRPPVAAKRFFFFLRMPSTGELATGREVPLSASFDVGSTAQISFHNVCLESKLRNRLGRRLSMKWGKRVKLGFTHGCSRRFLQALLTVLKRAGRHSGHTLLNTQTLTAQTPRRFAVETSRTDSANYDHSLTAPAPPPLPAAFLSSGVEILDKTP